MDKLCAITCGNRFGVSGIERSFIIFVGYLSALQAIKSQIVSPRNYMASSLTTCSKAIKVLYYSGDKGIHIPVATNKVDALAKMASALQDVTALLGR